MSIDVKIEVPGLNGWRKDLREVDPKLQRELGRAYKAIGGEIVARASSLASSLGGVAAKSAQALKATARATDVSIRLDGERFPWALGAEFGGGPPRTPQFKPWRGSGPDAGYFLYPTIRAESRTILDMFGEAVDAANRQAFPS